MYDPVNNINFYFQGLRYIPVYDPFSRVVNVCTRTALLRVPYYFITLMFYRAEALKIEINIIFRVVHTYGTNF